MYVLPTGSHGRWTGSRIRLPGVNLTTGRLLEKGDLPEVVYGITTWW